MSIHSISEKYPIGTKLRLANDDPGTVHEVYGYECCKDYANIIFVDGSKLSAERLELIVEVEASVEYNVRIPRKELKTAVHADKFWSFYNSDNRDAKLEYDAVDEAVKCQKAICMIINRNCIYDVTVTRRKNVLYLIREKQEEKEQCN